MHIRILTKTRIVNHDLVKTPKFPRYAGGEIARIPHPQEPNVPSPGQVINHVGHLETERTTKFTFANKSKSKPRPVVKEAPGMGRRRYDVASDTWMLFPKPPIPVETRRPARAVDVRTEGSGDLYWAVCRMTGAKMRSFRAMTAAAAAQIVNEFALNNGGMAGDAYALKEA